MEMEDHHPLPHPHHQQQEYVMPDLSQLMNNNRPTHHFLGIPQTAAAAEFLPGHHYRNLTPQQGHQHQYEMLMMPRGLQDFNTTISNANNCTSNNNSVAVAASVSTPSFSGFEGEAAASFGGDGGNGRWPRQETLTLLEIRSRLDSKFKETNQKGPIWDEVSSIMSEEHGYQRSGKKCREKFENLYKYYKKTKEGKAGRQDGKHYRFFRQLEALYGDSTSNSASVQETHLIGSSYLRFNHSTSCNNTTTNQETHHHKLSDHSLSLSNNNSSEFDSSSSDDNDLSTIEKRGERSLKGKIKLFIDSKMRKLMEKQEAWLEKLTETLEQKEQARVLREEEWRKQEQVRIDREHKFWAKERAWIEARDASLMEALQNLTGKQLNADQSPAEELMAKEGGNKKRKENNSRSSRGFFQGSEGSLYQGTGYECNARLQLNDSSSPGAASNSNVGNIAVSDSCLRFLMADGDHHLWENYGLKLSNGENQ